MPDLNCLQFLAFALKYSNFSATDMCKCKQQIPKNFLFIYLFIYFKSHKTLTCQIWQTLLYEFRDFVTLCSNCKLKIHFNMHFKTYWVVSNFILLNKKNKVKLFNLLNQPWQRSADRTVRFAALFDPSTLDFHALRRFDLGKCWFPCHCFVQRLDWFIFRCKYGSGETAS